MNGSPSREGRTIVGSAVLLAGLAFAGATRAELTPHSLTNVADEILRIYNNADAPALHRRLAPSLKAKYTVDAVREVLARCRAMTGEIARFSLPSYGARHFGFFGVYAQAAIFEMILEIDREERLFHWVITQEVTSRDQACSLDNFR